MADNDLQQTTLDLIRDRLSDIPDIAATLTEVQVHLARIETTQEQIISANAELKTAIEGNGKPGLLKRVSELEGLVGGIKSKCDAESVLKNNITLEKAKSKLSLKTSVILLLITMFVNVIVTVLTVKISSL
jgi:hypothetical protein